MSAAGAAGALAVCLVLLYLALVGQLWAALDAGLASRADDLTTAVRAGNAAELSGDPIAQLYDAHGAVVAGSAALHAPLLTPAEARSVRRTSVTARSLPVGPRGAQVPVRLMSQRVATGDGVLTVGASAEPVHAARRRLAAVLFVAAPLMVAVLAAAAWTVVRTALRPVGALSREAAHISSLETERRLPDVPGDDEIARLARTLNDMLTRLRVAAERERAFVDDASHELRTPIAVLRGELELALAARADPDEVESSLRTALGEAERLSRLADDLLLLARARAGTLVVRPEPVDLLDLAADEGRRLRGVLPVRIETSGDPVVVDADPDRLRQILVNLAGNSAAAGAGNVRVHLTAERDAAILEVADDGPGFSPEMLDAAFARFARGDDARTRAGGAGLGLSIVKAVVAAHGGTVAVGNGGPLGGAVVTVRLPQTGGA